VFKRFFWMSVGLSVGYATSFWLMRTVRRTVERFTPERIGRDVVSGARSFADELKDAFGEGLEVMRKREAELRADLDRRIL
jgi:hypothetical protein